MEYRQGAEAPVLRVRLQECFGLLDTPRIDDGRRPVLMELLSPGYKPVQLTSDFRYHLAVAGTDDYAHLTARRTVDKAARIAYLTMLQFLLWQI